MLFRSVSQSRYARHQAAVLVSGMDSVYKSVRDSVMNSVMNSVLFSVDEFTMEKLKLRLLQRRYGFLFVNLLGILLRILLNPLLRKN